MGPGPCGLVAGVFPGADVRGTIATIGWVSPARGHCSTHEGSVTAQPPGPFTGLRVSAGRWLPMR